MFVIHGTARGNGRGAVASNITMNASQKENGALRHRRKLLRHLTPNRAPHIALARDDVQRHVSLDAAVVSRSRRQGLDALVFGDCFA